MSGINGRVFPEFDCKVYVSNKFNVERLHARLHVKLSSIYRTCTRTTEKLSFVNCKVIHKSRKLNTEHFAFNANNFSERWRPPTRSRMDRSRHILVIPAEV